jgi:DNA-binding response OmpR family regulator
MAKANILLIEDDESLGFIVKDNLEMQGYAVFLATSANQALAFLKNNQPDVCIIDVMLPDNNGFALAENIVKLKPQLPFMFLTALQLKEDKIKGFKVGCDDYLTKPFSIEELQMRLEVILRRKSITQPQHKSFAIGKYTFDANEQLLQFKNEEKRITKTESQILKIFAEKQGQLIQRSEILLQVWGEDDYFKGRSLDVFISKIRKYLAQDKSISIINVPNSGFCLQVKE